MILRLLEYYSLGCGMMLGIGNSSLALQLRLLPEICYDMFPEFPCNPVCLDE